MPKIAMIAPFPELIEVAKEVCEELNEELDIRFGDRIEGLKEAYAAINQGAQAIISRGGTATLIKKTVDVPVIEIAVTGYDLMRAVNKAKKIHGSIGVVGYANVIYGIETLQELMDIKLEICTVNTDEETDKAILKMQTEGIKVIVGDNVAVKKASAKGLLTVLVCSGREAISQAIREARNTIEVVNNKRDRFQELKTLVNCVDKGIITLDSQRKINLINPVVEDILNVNIIELIGCYAEDVIPGLVNNYIYESMKPILGEVIMMPSGLIVKDSIPVIRDNQVVGVIITIQEAQKIQQASEEIRRKMYLKGNVARYTFEDLHTNSENMNILIKQAKKFAMVDSSILILGESGTGKEILCQSIHNHSLRKKEPFVAINCAAVPETLLESELFGYEEGAFTGAVKGGKAGMFEVAHRGTLFLDEIGEMPLNLQARLLRVLQEKVIRRIGGNKVISTDVRIIAATNKELLSEIRKGNFREDLYYRINILSLSIPPLRKRTKDIDYLVKVLINKLVKKTGSKPVTIDDKAISELEKHNWPGNVRELENLLERLVVLKSGSFITSEDIDIYGGKGRSDGHNNNIDILDNAEKNAIIFALEKNGWNMIETSKYLGISRTTLWRKIKKYGFNVET